MQPPPPPPPAPRLAECPGPGDAGLAFPAPDRRADPAKLKVATFNAEWLFDGVGDNSRSPWRDDPAGAAGHLARVADVLAGLDADLVNLAEVEDCAVLKALAENLNARPGNAGREYAPYLVKGKDTYTGQNVALLARVDPVGPLDRTEARAAYPVAGSACGYGGEAHDYGVSKHYRALFHIGGRAGVPLPGLPHRQDAVRQAGGAGHGGPGPGGGGAGEGVRRCGDPRGLQ